MTTDETDYTDDTDASPSQAVLDSRLQGQALLAKASAQGGLSLARSQILDAITDGADSAVGRELLGTIDQMEEFPESGDPAELYRDFRRFVGGQPASGQGAAPVQPPSATPPAARRPSNKRYSQLTSEERRAMSSSEIDAMTGKQSGEPAGASNYRRINKRMGS